MKSVIENAVRATGLEWSPNDAGYLITGTDDVMDVQDLMLIMYAQILRVHERMDALENQAASLASPDGIMGMIGGLFGDSSPFPDERTLRLG